MLSEFGKFSRKLRIEEGELLKDMATKLNVTPSYLSAVEVGKKAIPEKWISILIKAYKLNSEMSTKLTLVYENSLESVTMNIKEKNAEDKELIISFARNFDSLDETVKNELKQIFSK